MLALMLSYYAAHLGVVLKANRRIPLGYEEFLERGPSEPVVLAG